MVSLLAALQQLPLLLIQQAASQPQPDPRFHEHPPLPPLGTQQAVSGSNGQPGRWREATVGSGGMLGPSGMRERLHAHLQTAQRAVVAAVAEGVHFGGTSAVELSPLQRLAWLLDLEGGSSLEVMKGCLHADDFHLDYGCLHCLVYSVHVRICCHTLYLCQNCCYVC